MKVDFIVNTITAWDEPPRSRHQFTSAATKKQTVAFVSRNKLGFFRLKIYEGGNNTLVVDPYFPIDYRFRYRLPFINELYQIWLFGRLKKIFPTATVVNFDCTTTQLSRYFPNNVYYCSDEYAGNSKYKSRLVDMYISWAERIMSKKARFCVTTAHFLTQKLKKINPYTYEIPLGLSLEGEKITDFQIDKNKKRINVGMMGVINERQYSFHAVNRLLSNPRFNVIIVGPVTPEFQKKLINLDPQNLKGTLTGKKLFEQLKSFDVGLALYNLDFVNPGGTPNKVWQYLAVGKPAVVSDLPNMKYMKFPEQSVYITKSDDDLTEKIEKAYDESTVELMRMRVEFAYANTWDHRFAQFIELCNKHLSSAGQ